MQIRRKGWDVSPFGRQQLTFFCTMVRPFDCCLDKDLVFRLRDWILNLTLHADALI